MQLDIPYYSYRDTPYFSREDALDAMLYNNDFNSTLEFKFADNVFDKINWMQNIDVDIRVLYKLRAKQLRDKYDYLILSFSGGSDSTQILKTFLNNNIFLDEIQVVHHEKLISKLDEKEILGHSQMNELLEYKYAVQPMLARVAKESPKTKITTIDATDFSLSQFTNGTVATLLGDKDLPSPSNHRVYSLRPMVYHYVMNRHNLFSGKHGAAFIRGFEKPNLFFDNLHEDVILFSFHDMIMYSRREIYTQHLIIEDFYWSPDAPLIPVKQSHMIKRELENNRDFYEKFLESKNKIVRHSDPTSYSPALVIERELSRIIYPDFNPRIYAGGKSLKASAELVTIEHFDKKTPTKQIITEYANHKLNKYRQFKNQKQLTDLLYTKHYVVGHLNFKWKRFDV